MNYLAKGVNSGGESLHTLHSHLAGSDFDHGETFASGHDIINPAGTFGSIDSIITGEKINNSGRYRRL